jgi:4-hydroxyacetophenone monooxygenase
MLVNFLDEKNVSRGAGAMSDLQMISEWSSSDGGPSPTDHEAFVRRVVDQANLNALRLTLYQITGDPELAAMRVEQKPIRGGALLQNLVADEDVPRLKEKAIAFLLDPPSSVPPPPNDADSRELLKLFSSDPKSENFLRFGVEELAFAEFPRDVHWTNRPPQKVIDDFKVLVIGGGISGIGSAIQLQRLGIPYRVIERQSDIGGTWQLNNYPEARVDTGSYLYQFKFEKNYHWSEFFAARDETKRYLKHVAEKYEILPQFQYDTEVVAAKWDEERALWTATLRGKDGSEEQVTANVIVSGSGLFSTPNLPDIPGIESFEGEMFHTARWNHGYDFAGKKVALIGTGSSGTQLMPALAQGAEQLTIYQRTPNWIMALEGYRSPVSPEARWLFDNLPFYWNWYCYATFDTAMQLQGLHAYDREWQAQGGGINPRNDQVKAALTEYIEHKVGDDPVLLKKCMPSYPPLARRLVVDNGWYDALRRDNVELVTEPIERITPKGIVSADGEERQFDLIVLGAGFQTSRYLWPVKYEGRDGATLEKAWAKDGARSYLGISMPGFPNLFMFYGPNGQPRSGGFYSWAEVWARYSAGMIVKMIEGGFRSAEVKRDTFDSYNAELDEAMKEILWEREGAGGYYNNEFGRSGVNLPFLTEDYHAMVAEANPEDYLLR